MIKNDQVYTSTLGFLIGVFKALFSTFNSNTILIDGLDECDDGLEVLKTLTDIKHEL